MLSTLSALGKTPMRPTNDDKDWAYWEMDRCCNEIKNKIHFLLKPTEMFQNNNTELRFEIIIRHFVNQTMLPHLIESALVARIADKWLFEHCGYQQDNYTPILSQIRSQALKQACGFTRKSVL